MRVLKTMAIAMLAVTLAAPASLANSVTKIEDIQRGAQVTLTGEVIRILDEDEFRLRDETGSVQVYIGWRNRVMVDVGETVTVSGFVDDDLLQAFRPEVYARQIVREDGETIDLN